MPVVAVFTFVNGEWGINVMVVFSDSSGELSFFARVVANLMRIANPATDGLVDLIRI